MRRISAGLYVGVIVLQQLAQDKQPTSFHTPGSREPMVASMPRGRFLEIRVRKRRKEVRSFRKRGRYRRITEEVLADMDCEDIGLRQFPRNP